jgi:outer membrane protein OmpA-like peptidoglycan-associated protein
LNGGTIIEEGGSATLSWTSTDATACAAQSPPGWAGSSAPGGSAIVRPGQNTTYTIQCTGPGGNSNTASATVEVRIRPRTISILGAALFRFDSSNVDPNRAARDPVVRAALDSLNMLADRMNNAPTANVVFVGNTDYVGTNAYNDALSERRARSVYAYLSSRITDPGKLSNTIVWACGEKNANQTPPRPPEAEKGRFLDRNVTVYVNQPDNVIRAPNCRRIMP